MENTAQDNIEQIGARIKKLRKQKQITLQQLSEYTGLSIGFLSGVERETTSPSLQNLRQITEALGTTISDLISAERQERIFVRKKDARTIEFPQFNQTVTYIDFGISPIIYEIIVIQPGKPAERNESRHIHDECCTVISGQLVLELASNLHYLEEGDSVYIKKNTRHSIFNITDKPCVSYWIFLRQ